MSVLYDLSRYKPGNYVAASKILYNLEKKYGSSIFSQASNKMSLMYPIGIHPPIYKLEDFKNALVKVTGDTSILDLFSQNGF